MWSSFHLFLYLFFFVFILTPLLKSFSFQLLHSVSDYCLCIYSSVVVLFWSSVFWVLFFLFPSYFIISSLKSFLKFIVFLRFLLELSQCNLFVSCICFLWLAVFPLFDFLDYACPPPMPCLFTSCSSWQGTAVSRPRGKRFGLGGQREPLLGHHEAWVGGCEFYFSVLRFCQIAGPGISPLRWLMS